MKTASKSPAKIFLYGVMVCLVQLTLPSCQHGFQDLRVSPLPMADCRYNDYARFVAALPQEEGSALASLASTGWYAEYLKNAEKKWKKLEKERLAQMRLWAASELAVLNRESRYVLYAFSGPDFLHMFTLFPRAKRYVMIGREAVGSLPDLTSVQEAEAAEYLELLDRSLGDLYKRSYFITDTLSQDLSNGYLDGVLPLLSIFLERTGNRIIDIKYVHLNEMGEPVADTVSPFNGRQGVRIDFVDNEEVDEMRTLFYFCADLDSMALMENEALLRYLRSMEGFIAYIKSASYLMHSRFYAAIRSIILDRSSAYVGDDTGIPYAYFRKDTWTMQLYGKYVTPIDEFRGVDQADLRLAYEKLAIKPMPFNLGYHWNSGEQNLMVAIRKAASPQTLAPSPPLCNPPVTGCPAPQDKECPCVHLSPVVID